MKIVNLFSFFLMSCFIISTMAMDCEEELASKPAGVETSQLPQNSPEQQKDANGADKILESLKNLTCFKNCKVEIINVNDWLEHLEKSHPNSLIHKCRKCNLATFNKLDDLVKHVENNHEGINCYHCPFCHSILKNQKSFCSHLYRCHSGNEKKLKCKYQGCNYTCQFLSQLNKHKAFHSKKVIMCYLCDFSTLSLSNVFKHISKRHQGIDDLKMDMKCDICEINFENWRAWEQHMQTSHEDKKMYACKSCTGFKTHLQQDLVKHIEELHKAVKQKYKCPFCKYSMISKSNFFSHLYYLHGNKDQVDIPTETLQNENIQEELEIRQTPFEPLTELELPRNVNTTPLAASETSLVSTENPVDDNFYKILSRFLLTSHFQNEPKSEQEIISVVQNFTEEYLRKLDAIDKQRGATSLMQQEVSATSQNAAMEIDDSSDVSTNKRKFEQIEQRASENIESGQIELPNKRRRLMIDDLSSDLEKAKEN